MRILMVDDDPMVREAMRMLLELDGHEVHEADTGSKGLDQLDVQQFDLVFTDYSMPGMKGDQFAREAKERSRQTPIVMLSGSPPSPAPVEVVRVMEKPFNIFSIRDLLTEFAPEPHALAI